MAADRKHNRAKPGPLKQARDVVGKTSRPRTTKRTPRGKNERPSFTLRFSDESTHQTLALVAEELGVSMNQLAEDFIARELRVAVLGLEDDLSGTLQALRSYRGEGIDADLDAFARAEVEEEDPLTSTLAPAQAKDPHGIGSLFAQGVE